jgi:thermolysin
LTASVLAIGAIARPTALAQPTFLTIGTENVAQLRQWDTRLTALERDGELRMRERRVDPFVEGRVHERLDQFHDGVRVVGGDVVRQTDHGVPISVFGAIYDGLVADTTPALGPDEAKAAIERLAGVEVGAKRMPELVLAPDEDGAFVLAYMMRVFSTEGFYTYFVDAHTGTLAMKRNEMKSEAARGLGTGVLGDQKKISVSKSGSMYRTSDELRPPSIETYDMRGNVNRTVSFLNEVLSLGMADLASDTDNVWSDPASVDAHVYAGYVYDYYFKRFNRRGLDNRDIRIVSLVHPANRSDILRQPSSIVAAFYLNAGYFGNGVMIYGEGLPANLTDTEGRQWNYTSGALDVVAHELTHGVTDFTSGLIYERESGALNEAFSDMMGVAAEFFHQPTGTGPLHADYLLGEDVITPGGIRSMANPSAYGAPDHYSLRYTGTQDNGGVHTNSGIANNAYYLAIEGGTNRVSRLAVAGVGPDNREQIEKVFYRAFTEMLPSTATFAIARVATIQAARDLYGAGSAAERAVTQAWTAVGVN